MTRETSTTTSNAFAKIQTHPELPGDVWCEILSYLINVRDMSRALVVCKGFHFFY